MKNKIIIILLFVLVIGVFDFSQVYAEDRFLFLDSTNDTDYYLDSVTLNVTKDESNCIYYDAWIKGINKQEIQKLNVFTHQKEILDYRLVRMIFAINEDKKMMQIRSITDYGQSGTILFTMEENAQQFSDIKKRTVIEDWVNRITEYISKNHIEPIVVSNEKYLPLNEKEFYNLFKTNGCKIKEIEEVQRPNIRDGYYYGSSATPYSYLDKAIDHDIHFGVAGVDKQHLTSASVTFYVEKPHLLDEEKLGLFYITLQTLFPDWAKNESEKWVNNSIARMNKSNKLAFIYLHKGKEYIEISRQPIQDDPGILYVLAVSQIQPSVVNPINPYSERDDSIAVYEEWQPSQKK